MMMPIRWNPSGAAYLRQDVCGQKTARRDVLSAASQGQKLSLYRCG